MNRRSLLYQESVKIRVSFPETTTYVIGMITIIHSLTRATIEALVSSLWYFCDLKDPSKSNWLFYETNFTDRWKAQFVFQHFIYYFAKCKIEFRTRFNTVRLIQACCFDVWNLCHRKGSTIFREVWEIKECAKVKDGRKHTPKNGELNVRDLSNVYVISFVYFEW